MGFENDWLFAKYSINVRASKYDNYHDSHSTYSQKLNVFLYH